MLCLKLSNVASNYIIHISCKGLDVMSLAVGTGGTWNQRCFFLLTLLLRPLSRFVSYSEPMQQLHIQLTT